METKLMQIISKQEAKKFDREYHERNFRTVLMNKLILEINILLKVYYDDIEEESKKNNSFTIFEWKTLDSEFYTALGRKIRNSVFNEVTEMYESQNIYLSFTCEQYQKRISIKF